MFSSLCVFIFIWPSVSFLTLIRQLPHTGVVFSIIKENSTPNKQCNMELFGGFYVVFSIYFLWWASFFLDITGTDHTIDQKI